MFFKRPDLTSGSRPTLLPDETLLFVQDSVGLYEGKYKIAACQKGHAYLTSHRACYVDDVDPRGNSLAVDLRDVERHDFQAGFLRSSPKVTLYPKALRRTFRSVRHPIESPSVRSFQQTSTSSSSPVTRTNSPFRTGSVQTPPRQATATWICPICSFSNPVPSHFDSATATAAFPLPPCLACGIKPPFALVLKAAINAAANHGTGFSRSSDAKAVPTNGDSLPVSNFDQSSQHIDGKVICSRCTFHNHPSLQSCELCGGPLPTPISPFASNLRPSVERPESPGPQIANLNINDDSPVESVKFSFRAGGEKIFYERLKGAMIQRKWLLQDAPPIPNQDILRKTPDVDFVPSIFRETFARPKSTPVGIASLEQRGLQTRRNNETVIGTAFEDLEALMASAKEVVALAERFAAESGSSNASGSAGSLLSESAVALGMITTKDMLGEGSSTLYISELARNLAEYVTDERRGILRGQGGIMSLVDLWAAFNRSQNGVELISPSDFYKAAQLWEKLALPVRLRQFKSGLLAVQRYDWNDDKTLQQLRSWLHTLCQTPPATDIPWDWEQYGFGVTAQDAAQRFGWSIGVAHEELEMAEDRGILCREEGIEGLKFWLNHLIVENSMCSE